jgi:hypothetical protein
MGKLRTGRCFRMASLHGEPRAALSELSVFFFSFSHERSQYHPPALRMRWNRILPPFLSDRDDLFFVNRLFRLASVL